MCRFSHIMRVCMCDCLTRSRINFELKGSLLCLKTPVEHQNAETNQKSMFLGFTTNPSNMSRVFLMRNPKLVSDLKLDPDNKNYDIVSMSN